MLVELLVGVVLAVTAATLALNGVRTGFSTQASLELRGKALTDLRTAMQRTTREVRSADPVLAAQDDLLVLRTPDGAGTRRLTYSVVGGSLLLDVVATSSTGVVTTSPTQTVLRGLDPALDVFGYASVAGYTPPAGSGIDQTTCAIAGSTPASYDRDCIGSVTLRLSQLVRDQPTALLDDFVDVRNRS